MMSDKTIETIGDVAILLGYMVFQAFIVYYVVKAMKN